MIYWNLPIYPHCRQCLPHPHGSVLRCFFRRTLKVLQPRKEGPDWRMYGSHAVLSVRALGWWVVFFHWKRCSSPPNPLVELVALIWHWQTEWMTNGGCKWRGHPSLSRVKRNWGGRWWLWQSFCAFCCFMFGVYLGISCESEIKVSLISQAFVEQVIYSNFQKYL